MTRSRTLALTVRNTGFLLDRLGQDCHPLQFLRELTQNALEAITRIGGDGAIVWDTDWAALELDASLPFRLTVTDNGDGMTGPEMVRYINQLSSSGSDQSMGGNYGVGAKIAAATRNPHGVIYQSWKNGRGAMIHLWRDPESHQYGLRQFRRPDESFDHWTPLDPALKPTIIDQHGTRVILLGERGDQHTMEPPAGTPSPSVWIARYLNARYYDLPKGVEIRARQGWTAPRTDTSVNVLRRIVGQHAYLTEHATQSGTVKLKGASARWWILRNEAALHANSGWVESSGHVAALYQGELYELQSGRGGRSWLQNFGVLLGHSQVIIYVEPTGRITTNTARTHLLVGGHSLPWASWAAEFSAKMPAEIQAHMDDVASRSTQADHLKAIRERLEPMLDLYQVSRYRPTAAGKFLLDADAPSKGGRATPAEAVEVPDFTLKVQSVTHSVERAERDPTGEAGSIYSSKLSADGTPGAAAPESAFPEVRWISVADGTREPGDIEDRAARYVAERNALMVNGDFRVFRDMVDRFKGEFGDTPAARLYVEDAVRNWYEQALVETILGVQGVRNSREWSSEHIERALSEEALTSAVMQRYHVANAVKRELGTKLGRLRESRQGRRAATKRGGD